MEQLRVVFRGEPDHVGGGERVGATDAALPDLKVVQIKFGHSASIQSVAELAHRRWVSLPLNPSAR
jgi:hypothetical protein